MSMDLQDSVCAVCADQLSDLELEVDFLQSSPTVSEVVALPKTVLVIGESFCQCDRQEELRQGLSVSSEYLCGEDDQGEQKLMNIFIHHFDRC